ncbi:hypothetical protein, partial [Elioraea sp.]|uniref:hypothetical protein n=1 Tax=Elioraea sp. TaxID=2185103 RepID=UPI003F72E097
AGSSPPSLLPKATGRGYDPMRRPETPALEADRWKGDVWTMQGDRDKDETWQVEVLPAERRQGAGAPPPQGSRVLGTVILVAAIAAGLGILALLVVFAATIALIAVPVALGAALLAWAGVKWRSLTDRRGR